MRRKQHRSPAVRSHWNIAHKGVMSVHETTLRQTLIECYAADPSASSVAVLAFFEARGLGRLLGRDTCNRRSVLHDLIHSGAAKRQRMELANAAR